MLFARAKMWNRNRRRNLPLSFSAPFFHLVDRFFFIFYSSRYFACAKMKIEQKSSSVFFSFFLSSFLLFARAKIWNRNRRRNLLLSFSAPFFHLVSFSSSESNRYFARAKMEIEQKSSSVFFCSFLPFFRLVDRFFLFHSILEIFNLFAHTKM